MPAYTVISYEQVQGTIPVTEIYNFLVEKYHEQLEISQGIVVAPINEQIPPHNINFFINDFLPILKELNDNYRMALRPVILMNVCLIDRHIHLHRPSNLNQTLGSAFNIIELEPFRLYTYLQNNFNTDYSAQPIDRVSDNNKYLCKFGKLNKPNSFLIFGLLKDTGLLQEEHGLWSLAFNNSKDFKDETDEVFAMLHLLEYVQNIPRYDYSKYHKVLDRDFSNSFERGQMHYTGFPFDVNHYANTRYSIVRETNCGNEINLFISEKTWLPISMKHPFMLFATSRVAKYLRDSGYVSLDDFQMSELGNVNFSEAKELFVENHNKFLTTSKAEIQNMVEHNYELFLKHVKSDIDKLLSMPAEFLNLGCHEMTGTFLDLLLIMHYPNREVDPVNDNWDWQALRQYSPDK